MKMIAFPVELFQAVGNYLLSKPMGEVRKLVEQIEKEAKEIEVKEPDKKSEERTP